VTQETVENFDDFKKSPISAPARDFSEFAACALKTYTYDKYSEFFKIKQALTLNFLQSRRIATFYASINFGGIVKSLKSEITANQ